MMILILTGMAMLASCAATKVEETTKKESKDAKDAFMQAEIRQAIEMRRFIIKFDRLYSSRGSRVDLIPKSNYIILDGDKVIISAAYIGRQYSNRPIKGIDMIGKAVSFELKNNTTKGTYEIRMKVKNEMNTFDVFLTLTKDGNCNTSLTSNKIDYVRYTGNFVPLRPKEEKEKEKVPENALPENMSI
jgi:hypothetical protein